MEKQSNETQFMQVVVNPSFLSSTQLPATMSSASLVSADTLPLPLRVISILPNEVAPTALSLMGTFFPTYLIRRYNNYYPEMADPMKGNVGDDAELDDNSMPTPVQVYSSPRQTS